MFRVLVGLLFFTGCRVIDAPEEFEELVVFGFVNFEEHQDFVDAAAEGLVPYVESNDKVREDLEGDGVKVSALVQEDLDTAGIDRTLEEEVVGTAGLARMVASLDDVAQAVTYPKLHEIFERTVEFDVDSDTDRACFLSKECSEHYQSGERVTEQPFIGQSRQAFDMGFRWAALEDGRDVLLMRTLVPDPTEVSLAGLAIHQNYVYTAFFESEGDTVRVETNWIDAEFAGIDLPKTFAIDAALGAMRKQAEEIDAWVAGE